MRYSCTLGTGAFVGRYSVVRRGVMLLFRAHEQAGTRHLNAIFPLQYLVGKIPGGVYWKPVYHVLIGTVEVFIGNAHELRSRPGKKTDKRDAAWIAELLAHGLIRPSFVPPPTICALRDVTRTRVALVQTRSQSKNRVHKLLEDTNLKLGSVVSDLFGVTGRRILAALVAGERDPHVLASLALGTLKHKRPQLALALTGQFTAHHGTLLALLLELIEMLDRQIATLDQEIGTLVAPLQAQIAQLDSIPGVDITAARDILAEIGTDMSHFGDAARLASWAGVCPGNHESAGKRYRGTTCKGNRYLRRVLVQCAWGARKTPTFLGRTFRRLEVRIGKKKAALAIAHNRLVIVYQLLAEGTCYEEARYDQRNPGQEARERHRAITALERLGSTVTVERAASSAGRRLLSSAYGIGWPFAPKTREGRSGRGVSTRSQLCRRNPREAAISQSDEGHLARLRPNLGSNQTSAYAGAHEPTESMMTRFDQVSSANESRWGWHVAIARPSCRAQGVTTNIDGVWWPHYGTMAYTKRHEAVFDDIPARRGRLLIIP